MGFDFKRWIEAALPVLRMAAALTATPWDDRAVDVLAKIVGDEELFPWLGSQLVMDAPSVTSFSSLPPDIQARFSDCGCKADIVTHFLTALLPYLVEQLGKYLNSEAA